MEVEQADFFQARAELKLWGSSQNEPLGLQAQALLPL